MYKNKCIKCGIEFETKNPKRVICPSCLYPDRNNAASQPNDNALNQPTDSNNNFNQNRPNNFTPQNQGYRRPDQGQQGGFSRPRPSGYNQGGYNQGPPRQGGYNQGGYNQGPPRQGGFNQGGYNQGPPRQGGFNQGGYNQGPPRQGGFNQGGYNQGPPRQGGFSRPRPGGFNQGPPRQGGFNRPQYPQRRPSAANKKLLVSREQVNEIENLYKEMLPLPNPDCHEVIGEKIELEANKVFFGINLVRQKLMLPKLPYPKRKLAVSAEQLMAIQNLYEPLLPLPPIGCHKILAKQLKIDEWRVHVGIGIVRKQMELPRWNTDREDAPEEFKNQPAVEETPPSEEKAAE